MVGGLVQAYNRGIEKDREKERKAGVDVVKEEAAEGSRGRGSSGREITATPILLQPARRLPISLRGAPVLS